MLPFRGLTPKSRRVIYYITLTYAMTVLALVILARSASAEVQPIATGQSEVTETSKTVGIRALDHGGLFLATDDPTRLMPAPLQSTDVDISVSGPIARVTVRQTFTNPGSNLDAGSDAGSDAGHEEGVRNVWLEGIYTFPLPDKSAVDRLFMEIGERRIKGEIQERAQARKTYIEAKKAGKRTSLVSQERPNIFTTEVANIGPNDSIVIEIQYQETLRYDGGNFAMRFPMVVRPRFIPGRPVEAGLLSVSGRAGERPTDNSANNGNDVPGKGWSYNTPQVPDADRITPQVAVPAGGILNPVEINVELDPGFPIDRIWSPYHLIDVEKTAQDRFHIALADGQVPADSDFVLQWRPSRGTEPTAGMFTEVGGDDAHHVMMIMPPAAAPEDISSHNRETVFILDTSGSMGGTAIVQAKAALALALNRLTPGDSFNIIEFNSNARSLYANSQPASAVNLAQARNFVNSLSAQGGTNMQSALALALTGQDDLPHLRQIVFITDGAVGNEEHLFTMIHQGLGDSRLFTVGISSSPNSFFMSEAAEVGRGSFTFIGTGDEVEEKMAGLFRKLERPLLTDLKIEFPANAGSIEQYPPKLPDLYDGEPVVVAMRAPKGATGQVVVKGRMAGKPWQRTLDLASGEDNPGIGSIWARAKITDINRRARRSGRQNADTTREAVLKVALAHQLLSKYTSLVAVDDTPARSAEDPLLASAVPGNLPKGMDPKFVTMKSPSRTLTINKEALARGTAGSLPNTATPAALQMLSGLIALLMAAVLFFFARGCALPVRP